MNIYHLWITLPNPYNEAQIIAELAKKGYEINPADASGKISINYDDTTSLIALQLSYSLDEPDLKQKILNDVDYLLYSKNIKYYSIVVALHNTESLWISNYHKKEEFLIVPEKSKNVKLN